MVLIHGCDTNEKLAFGQYHPSRRWYLQWQGVEVVGWGGCIVKQPQRENPPRCFQCDGNSRRLLQNKLGAGLGPPQKELRVFGSRSRSAKRTGRQKCLKARLRSCRVNISRRCVLEKTVRNHVSEACFAGDEPRYLVDPASSCTLLSRTKPCTC